MISFSVQYNKGDPATETTEICRFSSSANCFSNNWHFFLKQMYILKYGANETKKKNKAKMNILS